MPGMIDYSDVDEFEAEVIVEDVMEVARQEYNLRELCRVVSMDKLEGTIRMIDGPVEGSEKVGELEEAPLDSADFAEVNFNLWKNVAHVAISNEAQHRDSVNVFELNVTDAGRELARMENKQIAEEMEEADDVSGSSWSDDSNEPKQDLFKAKKEIKANAFNADAVAMHPDVYADMVTNDNVGDDFERGSDENVSGEVANYAGLDIYTDNELPDGSAFVLDRTAPAMVLGEGPTDENSSDLGSRFGREYAIAKYIQPKILKSDAIRELTGL